MVLRRARRTHRDPHCYLLPHQQNQHRRLPVHYQVPRLHRGLPDRPRQRQHGRHRCRRRTRRRHPRSHPHHAHHTKDVPRRKTPRARLLPSPTHRGPRVHHRHRRALLPHRRTRKINTRQLHPPNPRRGLNPSPRHPPRSRAPRRDPTCPLHRLLRHDRAPLVTQIQRHTQLCRRNRRRGVHHLRDPRALRLGFGRRHAHDRTSTRLALSSKPARRARLASPSARRNSPHRLQRARRRTHLDGNRHCNQRRDLPRDRLHRSHSTRTQLRLHRTKARRILIKPSPNYSVYLFGS